MRRPLVTAVLVVALLVVGAPPAIAQDAATPTTTICPSRAEAMGMSVRVLTPLIQSGATGAIEVSAPKGTYLRLAERHAGEARFERITETVFPDSDGRFVHRFMTSSPTTAAYEVQFGGGGPYVWPGCPVPFFDGATYGQRLVIEAATVLTLRVERTGPRAYHFSGRHAGHDRDVISLYRADDRGRSVLTAQTRASGDVWTLHRVFLGSGTYDFHASSGADVWNAAGRSETRRVTIR